MSDEYVFDSISSVSEEDPFNKVAEEIVLNDHARRNHLSGQVQAILSIPISIYHLAESWTSVTTDHLWRTSKKPGYCVNLTEMKNKRKTETGKAYKKENKKVEKLLKKYRKNPKKKAGNTFPCLVLLNLVEMLSDFVHVEGNAQKSTRKLS
jgi:hypothetical protein